MGETGNKGRDDMTDSTKFPRERRGRVTSGAIMGNAKEIVIEHAGTEYILRITSQNKLILTK
jgi:hemin uptake protein HemP